MKKGVKTFFATLLVAGALATLTACTTKHVSTNTYDPNIDDNGGYEQIIDDENTNPGDIGGGEINPDNNGGNQQVDPADEGGENKEIKPGDENVNGGEINPDDETSSDPEIDEEEIKIQQLKTLESNIETKLAGKLNSNFGEELVENVDVKYFSLEQDSQLNTTIFANGAIKFANDDTIHSIKLGLPLEGDSFTALSPLYYLDIDQEKDLEQNYGIDDLTAIKDFVANEDLEFNSAKLDGKNWNYKALTSAQIEKQLEQEYELKARQFFKQEVNTEYIKDLDFKYISTEYNSSYGYMISLFAKTGNIFNDNIKELFVKIIVSKEDYDYLNAEILNEVVNPDGDLKDNYTADELNQVVEIINKDSSYVKFYKIDGTSYKVNESNYKLTK